MTVDTERWYAFKQQLHAAITACIKTHLSTSEPVWAIPGAGFVELKCCHLDEVIGDHGLVAVHMWHGDHDFIELADAISTQEST